MVWRLTLTRRARSEAPTPLLLRIWLSRFSTRVFTSISSRGTECISSRRLFPGLFSDLNDFDLVQHSDRARAGFVLRHHQPEASRRAEKRFAVGSVRHQDLVVDEAGIELGKREQHLISVVRRSEHVGCESFSAEVAALRNAGLLQHISQPDAFVNRFHSAAG